MKRAPEAKKKLLQRVRRAHGQLAAIERMVEDDAYCVDVLVQIAAVQGALGRVGELLLGDHVAHCVADAFASGDAVARQAKVDELLDVFGRFGGLRAGGAR